MGDLIVVLTVLIACVYIAYYPFLYKAAVIEYGIIFDKFYQGRQKGFDIDLPEQHEVSFEISFSDYRRAKAYNKKMAALYKEIDSK